MARRLGLPFACTLGLGVLGCGLPDEAPACGELALGAGEVGDCMVPGYVDRGVTARAPAGWDGRSPLPVLLVFHGGGSNRVNALRVSCAGGDEASPTCLHVQADARGYLVVAPDGTGRRPTRGVRTWNAGGGTAEFGCVSGGACATDVDDLAFVRGLLAELEQALPIDRGAVVATGISNGGAISHRLACEAPGLLAAIASVAGVNQHAAAGGACAAQLPVLAIHGDADPAWPYAGGLSELTPEYGPFVGVEASLEAWRQRNGCAATFVDDALPDAAPADGTTAVRRTWEDCAAATARIAIAGGGHTWPSGNAYADAAGPVTRDFGSEVILDFFDAALGR